MNEEAETQGVDNISDADSEGEEADEIRVKPIIIQPNQEEVDKHMNTHIPYRSWCKHCVRGKGVNDQHKKSQSESRIAIISIDYAFAGESSEERKQRKERIKRGEEEDESKGMPVLAVLDHQSGNMEMELVPKERRRGIRNKEISGNSTTVRT